MLVAGQRAAIAFPGEQRRRALFAEYDVLVAFVPGHAFKGFVLILGRAQVVSLEVREIQLLGAGVNADHGQGVHAFIDNGHLAVLHDCHTFRVIPAVERHFAQHVALQAQLHEERVLPITENRVLVCGL